MMSLLLNKHMMLRCMSSSMEELGKTRIFTYGNGHISRLRGDRVMLMVADEKYKSRSIHTKKEN